MRNAIEIRLEIVRSVREDKFKALDLEVSLAIEQNVPTIDLYAKKQRYRDLTEPYKALLLQETIEQDETNQILSHQWDVFTSVSWS
jgi:hypothetical protein